MRPNLFGRLTFTIGALLAAIVSFVASYAVFGRLFIMYWEWEHSGRRMKFTVFAYERALPWAFAVSGGVFYVIFLYLQRKLAPRDPISPRSIALVTVTAVVVLYVCTVEYVFYTVSRFGR